ncbi:carboxypeptidase N subunit 2-like [Branchiostoma floridae]|uniref:Carboxypeptidase N subunit 2-like n=2 Tax=Branchiostoma floridae TaxID=7739 RepID=A0A9J7LEN0_BRAFL|nr:carboxypeptidase N subunit 2-like [Branchiostoma floridae]
MRKEHNPKLSSSCATTPACVCRSNEQLTGVPQDLPSNITALLLDQNWMEAVHRDNFSRYGSLEYLDLSDNSLSRIDSRTFANLTNLRRLELFRNRINSLAVDAFAGLDNLETLALSINYFESLVGTMFAGLGNLVNLYLNGCSISSIQGNPFALLGNLKVLNLHQNLLTSLSSDMFNGLYSLETLTLDSNKITSIESRTFYHNGRLKLLSMSENKISTIPDGTFVNQYQIQYILLSKNSISGAFPVGAFPTITWWSSVEMGENRMETLPATAYDKLASFASAIISDNPWQCDCRMAPFKQKMNGSHAFESQIICAGPASLADKSLLQNVSVAEMVCAQTATSPPDATPTANSVQGSTSADSGGSSSTTRGQPEMTQANAGPAIGMSSLLVILVAFLGKLAVVPYQWQ